MSLEAQINLITVPQEFARLCNALMRAEHGEDFLAVDDDVPDAGNDGYLRSERRMYAMHCFKRPQNQGIETLIRRKMVGDLGKAIALKRAGEWGVDAWTFISNYPVSERVGAEIVRIGEGEGVAVSWAGPGDLAVLLEAHPAVQARFPSLLVNRVADQLGELSKSVAELAGDRALEPADPTAVPENAEQQARLIAARPPLWEFLLFASALRLGLRSHEFEYLDHKMGIAYERAEVDFYSSTDVIGDVFSQLSRVFEPLDNAMQPGPQEHAFGPPGLPGDALAIQHRARCIINAYQAMLSASRQLRAIEPPRLMRYGHSLALQQVGVQIETVRSYVEMTISEIARLPDRIEHERPIVLDLVLEVALDPVLRAELDREIERVSRKVRRSKWTGLDIEQR